MPKPNRTETRLSPNTLTRVAKTEGSCYMLNYAATTRQITIIAAPMHNAPIRRPFSIRDYRTFLDVMNYPESQKSCTKGRTSQHMKKFM